MNRITKLSKHIALACVITASFAAAQDAPAPQPQYVFRAPVSGLHGKASPPSGVQTPPATPVLSVPSRISNNTLPATASWNGVAAPDGALVSYELDGRAEAAGWEQIFSGPATWASIPQGSPSGSVYYLRLRACSAGGCSGYATASTTVLDLARVQNFQASPMTVRPGDSVNLSWASDPRYAYVISWYNWGSGVSGSMTLDAGSAAAEVTVPSDAPLGSETAFYITAYWDGAASPTVGSGGVSIQ